jgi:hypothetical protein
MKCVGKIAIGLVGGLVLIAGARADTVALADNPYTPIVTRNIFGLNPVQADETPSEPPPKITLNGIMSIYGKLQALYKVAGSGKPGQPDQSYMLTEGQRQNDIEVMSINSASNLVTFNNHGTVQEIPLANAPAATGAGPGQGGLVSRGGNFSKSMGRAGGADGNIIGNSSPRSGFGRLNRSQGNNASQNPNTPAMGGGAAAMQSLPTRAGNSNQQQTQNTMDPAEQAILIAAQHAQLQQEGNPMAAIFPPTPIDAEVGVIPSEPPAGQPPIPPPAPGGGRVR